MGPKRNCIKVTKVLEDQIMPVVQSSVEKKSYNIHPLNNKIVEAFEILNAKTLLHALE